jgi:hypothetical protein
MAEEQTITWQEQARSVVPVVWRQRPFVGSSRMRLLDAVPHMPTIAEIVADIPADELPRGFAELGEVRINDEKVPRELWHLVRPRWRPGRDTVVTLHVPLGNPGGGGSSGGGGKNTLAMVASIAVLLIAAVVSGGVLGLPGIGILSASAVNAIAGGSIGVGGDLKIRALQQVQH